MRAPLYLSIPSAQDFRAQLPSQETDPFDCIAGPQDLLFLGKKAPLAALSAFGIQQNAEFDTQKPWALAKLVHLHATRDHLVLTEPTLLSISDEEEQALRDSVLDLIQEFAPYDFLPRREEWVFPAGEFSSLKAYSPDQANGLNIDVWQASDTHIAGVARKWRRTQNEIQMIWHDHPVNLSRVNRGQLPINSIWIYGIGALSELTQHPLLDSVSRIISNKVHLKGLAKFLDKPFIDWDLSLAPQEQLELIKTSLEGAFVDLAFLAEDRQENWEILWEKILEILHLAKIEHIQLLSASPRGLHTAAIHQKMLQPTIWESLFARNKIDLIRYPTWRTLAQRSILWKEFPSS